MTTSHESVLQKIAADFNHYAERESAYYANASKISTRLLIAAKMALLIPGFQFVMARRLQELLEQPLLIREFAFRRFELSAKRAGEFILFIELRTVSGQSGNSSIR